MVSAKQWGYVIKGARKLGHAIRGGRGSIHMAKDAAGAYAATGKRATIVGEGVGAAYRKVKKGVAIIGSVIDREPNISRAAVMGTVGAGIGVTTVRNTQRRNLEPRTKFQTTGELAGGAIAGALGGAWASRNIGYLSRVAKPTIRGLKRGNRDAILRTATVGIGGTASGILAHERVRRDEQLMGENRPKLRALRIGASSLTGAAFGVPNYAWGREGILAAKAALPLAIKGHIGPIATVGVVGGFTGLSASSGASQAKRGSKGYRAKQALLATQGAISGAAFGRLLVGGGQKFAYEFKKAKADPNMEFRFKMPKFGKKPKH